MLRLLVRRVDRWSLVWRGLQLCEDLCRLLARSCRMGPLQVDHLLELLPQVGCSHALLRLPLSGSGGSGGSRSGGVRSSFGGGGDRSRPRDGGDGSSELERKQLDIGKR
eukprot:1399525-Prymnesium_polylepis.1